MEPARGQGGRIIGVTSGWGLLKWCVGVRGRAGVVAAVQDGSAEAGLGADERR